MADIRKMPFFIDSPRSLCKKRRQKKTLHCFFFLILRAIEHFRYLASVSYRRSKGREEDETVKTDGHLNGRTMPSIGSLCFWKLLCIIHTNIIGIESCLIKLTLKRFKCSNLVQIVVKKKSLFFVVYFNQFTAGAIKVLFACRGGYFQRYN